jgi:hypothetical protein
MFYKEAIFGEPMRREYGTTINIIEKPPAAGGFCCVEQYDNGGVR